MEEDRMDLLLNEALKLNISIAYNLLNTLLASHKNIVPL
jgi:hypothetical protein